MCAAPAYMGMSRGIERYFVGSNRRWERYNRSLVDRVYDLMDPGFLIHCRNLLEEINLNKRGRPFKTPNAFIAFLAKIRAMFSIPFRSIEAWARIVSRVTGILSLSYSSLFKRIRSIIPVLDTGGGKVYGAGDSSGFKITIRGDYLGSKWKKRKKGWQKLHVVVSIHDVSVIAFTITDEHGNDARYGKRRIVEIYFSGLKRTMGEVIKAIRPDNIAQEIAMKVVYYNEMRRMTEAY